MRRERDAGSGTVLVVGAIGGITAVAVGSVAASSLWVERAAAASAADSAALAAADAAAGYIAVPPCEAAAEMAAHLDARITSCEIEGTTSTVRVESSGGSLGIPVSARARAGQPADPAPG